MTGRGIRVRESYLLYHTKEQSQKMPHKDMRGTDAATKYLSYRLNALHPGHRLFEHLLNACFERELRERTAVAGAEELDEYRPRPLLKPHELNIPQVPREHRPDLV